MGPPTLSASTTNVQAIAGPAERIASATALDAAIADAMRLKPLITSIDPDDACSMRSKLSHSPSRNEGRSDAHRPAIATGGLHDDTLRRRISLIDTRLLIPVHLMFVLASMGCPLSNEHQASDPSRAATQSHASDSRSQAAVEFHWPSKSESVVMKLDVATKDSEGTIEIELMPELAPESVGQMIRLARDGQYDGTTFHRVIRGFMIQGGDPNSRDQDPSNDGKGGAALALPDEFSNAPFERGVVALANRGHRGSTSSQFFILQSDHRNLDGRYTAVGRVTRGIEFVDAIANTPTDKVGRWGPKDRPIENVSIRRAEISPPTGQDRSGQPGSETPTTTLRLSDRSKPANPPE